MIFIGQKLKHVHMTYSFLELLIFFWLTQDIYLVFDVSESSTEVYFSSHQRNTVCEYELNGKPTMK